MKSNTVLISGAGQLGSRYLQGLVKCSSPLSIWVSDPSSASLALADERWRESGGTESKHSLQLIDSMTTLPQKLDLVIVATNADVRADVVETIASISRVRFWVLEKVLAQSKKDLDRLTQLTARSEGAWVNLPRRMMPWFQEIAGRITHQNPTEVHVVGGNWGLACNSVHFLDLGAYLLKEALVCIDGSGLNCNWHASKRAGFFEVNGILRAQFSGEKWVTLKCVETDENMAIEVKTSEGLWQINECNGEAIAPDGQFFSGRLEYQSEMTARLVETIIDTGACELPSLDQAVVLHRPFLNTLITHWNQSQKRVDTKLPIT
ncbi:hypothetical protein OAX30_02815 [Pseudomonadales bacterium]|nr:hypothetical protein [Pseudomonadales bacterium]